MVLVKILFMLAITAVIAEFGLHVMYHWKTGDAGLYDPPFEYLNHLDKMKRRK